MNWEATITIADAAPWFSLAFLFGCASGVVLMLVAQWRGV